MHDGVVTRCIAVELVVVVVMVMVGVMVVRRSRWYRKESGDGSGGFQAEHSAECAE